MFRATATWTSNTLVLRRLKLWAGVDNHALALGLLLALAKTGSGLTGVVSAESAAAVLAVVYWYLCFVGASLKLTFSAHDIRVRRLIWRQTIPRSDILQFRVEYRSVGPTVETLGSVQMWFIVCETVGGGSLWICNIGTNLKSVDVVRRALAELNERIGASTSRISVERMDRIIGRVASQRR